MTILANALGASVRSDRNTFGANHPHARHRVIMTYVRSSFERTLTVRMSVTKSFPGCNGTNGSTFEKILWSLPFSSMQIRHL